MRALVVALLVAGCGIDWPDAQRGDSLGPEVRGVEQGPRHRPGQPCLWCHGGPFPSAPEFGIAGTVYRNGTDTTGVEGAVVTITDRSGRVFSDATNEAGNFYTERSFEFPLQVVVELGGTRREMWSEVGRDGSCAACHLDPADGATTVGKVWVESR